MKSSTIRRSTLSRETMEVIENLAKEQDPNGLNEYVRPEDIESSSSDSFSSMAQEKAQEIDLLWQTFKNSQFNTKSPVAYLSIGFVCGAVFTFLMLGGLGVFVVKSDVNVNTSKHSVLTQLKSVIFPQKTTVPTLEQQADNAEKSVNAKVSVPSEDETSQNNVLESSVQNSSDNTSNVDLKNSKVYIVKEGDTGESIIKHYFGSYSPEKAELIMKANNLKNLDRINIGQEIIIPVE